MTIAVAAFCLFAASCGSDDGASEAAELPSLDGETESAGSDGGTDEERNTGEIPELSEAETSRALEQYRDCMLGALPAGSTVEVSNGPDGPSISISVTQGDLADEERANDECDPILDDLERSFIGSPEDIALRRDMSAKAIECLSERGYQSGENGLTLSIDAETGFLGVDIDGDGLEETDFALAEEECLLEAGFE